MREPRDRPHAEIADALQPRVAPAPVVRVRTIRGDALPQHGVTQRLEADGGEQVEVFSPLFVPGAHRLVEELVPDAIDGALVSAPQLKPLHPVPFSAATPRQAEKPPPRSSRTGAAA